MNRLKQYLLIILFLVFRSAVFSQTESNSEKEIVNLQISFQQNRFTNPNEAKVAIERAIAIAKTIDSESSLLTCKILLGEFYDDNNNFNLAYAQYTEAILIANNTEDYTGLAKAKYNMGFLFYKQNTEPKQKQALTYFKETIFLSKKSKDVFLEAKALNLISFIYYDLNDLDKAEQNALKALALFKKIKKTTRIPQCYITLARVNNKKDNFNKALDFLNKAIDLYKKSNNHLEINNALLVKSEVYLRTKQYKKALLIAQQVNDDPKVMTEQKIYALQLLYEINKSMNNHKKSLDYLEENKLISDSLFKMERSKMEESVRGEIDAKNQLKSLEKENEINELKIKENNYLIISLISILVLLSLVAIIMFLMFRQNKLKNEREKIKLEQESIQMEQKLLRTQMNPHFIANALAAIQGNIYKQDKEKSVTYLSKFAKLMRFILESSREKEILLSKEILSLKNYLDLQKLLLEDKLNYTVTVDDILNTDEILIPPMLIQPYVENAIKHGVELQETNGNVTLNFYLFDDKTLQIDIVDDGKGVKEVARIYEERKSKHLSFSTNITNERINNYNTKSHHNIKSNTQDVLVDGVVKGTKVTLFVPIKKMFD
jgi:tetratricopeptide (TPR) repeat protein